MNKNLDTDHITFSIFSHFQSVFKGKLKMCIKEMDGSPDNVCLTVGSRKFFGFADAQLNVPFVVTGSYTAHSHSLCPLPSALSLILSFPLQAIVIIANQAERLLSTVLS